MKFIVGLFLILFSIQSSASENDFMEFGNEDYEAKKSDWLIELGAKYYKWDLELPVYKGTHHNIDKKEEVPLFGAELAFGGEVHLFAGLSFSLKARGFYLQEMSGELGKASKDFDYDLAEVETDTTMAGGEGAASLNYTFVGDIVEFQPFAELAVGVANLYSKVDYDFEGLPSGPDAEYYEAKLNQDFITRRLSVGMNIISKYGIYSYFKVSAETYTLNKSKLSYKYKDENAVIVPKTEDSQDDLNKEISFTTYALGFGYLF